MELDAPKRNAEPSLFAFAYRQTGSILSTLIGRRTVRQVRTFLLLQIQSLQVYFWERSTHESPISEAGERRVLLDASFWLFNLDSRGSAALVSSKGPTRLELVLFAYNTNICVSLLMTQGSSFSAPLAR